MSYADEIFVKNMRQILETGHTTEKFHNRPKWEDGSEAWTIQTFGLCNMYDLRKEFPAITLRKTGLKSAMDEILWIYQRKSNNIRDLNSHIWDAWADKDGCIGSTYGYQVGQTHIHKIIKAKDLYNADTEEMTAAAYTMKLHDYLSKHAIARCQPSRDSDEDDGTIKRFNDLHIILDQMDGVLYDLKNDPMSRRIMISLWNVEDLVYMNLQPCCWSINFVVTDEGDPDGKLVLNMAMHQRSADMLTANNWNVTQYALLLMMVAQSVGMIPGKLMHTITNAHIYNKHIPMVKELIERPQYPAPKVTLDPSVTNFYDFTTDHLTIENYEAGPQIKIPVAI